MHRSVLPVAIVFGLLLATPAWGQPAPVKDPAQLFPADTLFYAELTKPAGLAHDLETLTKGSVLDDLPAYIAKLREKRGEDFFFVQEILGIFGTFIGPEMLSEMKRLQGGAVAITGFNQRNEPEIVGVLLSGESNVPGFIMRAFLTSYPFLRVAGQVEGVTIYAEGRQQFMRVGPGGAVPPPQPPPSESVCFTQLPGAIIIGSNKELVGDVIQRLRVKSTKPNLTSVASFQESGALRQRPGVFFFGNPAKLAEKMEAHVKGPEPQVWAVAKDLVNPKAIRSLAGSLSLHDGNLDLQLAAKLEPKQSSLLLDLLADQRVNPATLQPVPKDAAIMVTLPLSDGEKYWQRVLAAADAGAKAGGQIGALPSDLVKEIEGKLKISVGKDLAGKIAALTLVMPAKQDVSKDGTAIPILMIAGVDEPAAQRLEELIPTLAALAIGDGNDPVTETVQGVKIRSLPGAAMPWKTPLHYGRKGALLVIGQDRKLVAASLNRPLNDSLAADPRFMDVLKGHADASVLGCWQWGETLAEWVREQSGAPPIGVKRIAPVPPPPPPPAPAPAKEKGQNPLTPLVEQARKLPPLVVSLSRQKDEVRLSVRQAELKGSAPKLIDGAFDLMMKTGRGAGAGFEGGGGGPPPPAEKN